MFNSNELYIKNNYFKCEKLATRLLAAKKVELELKAVDESKFDRTMEELCQDESSNDLWLKCTHGNSVKFQ